RPTSSTTASRSPTRASTGTPPPRSSIASRRPCAPAAADPRLRHEGPAESSAMTNAGPRRSGSVVSMATNRLSIVVPAHNEQRYIAQCLAALLAQKSEIHEILVVDNNSTDRTAQIIEAIAAGEPLVRRIVEPRPGVAFARNAGFDAATGDLIGRIDADTRVRPGWAHTVRSFVARDDTAEVGAISGLGNSYDSPYRGLKQWYIDKRVAQGVFGGERRIDNLHGANMALR